MSENSLTGTRETVFISKATPGDDEFVLWLAPRLEAAGYKVFADVLSLQGGDRWRQVVTRTLHKEAVKMLLVCRDSSLEKDGVQEEIGIALDLVKELKDPRFIIPLRLERYKKLFGIGELQYIDFVGSWANGLDELLDTLERQQLPCDSEQFNINPNWELYRKRMAIELQPTPEILTSNWLRIRSVPEHIFYYQPKGSVNHTAMERACKTFAYPAEAKMRGFFSFASLEDINPAFVSAGTFEVGGRYALMEFMEEGSEAPKVEPNEAHNMVSSMFRQAWENHCRDVGFFEYLYSNQAGFHASEAQIAIGKKIPWGEAGQRRSAMLRNIARNKVWQYGVSANPVFWPYPHFKLKARVLFADIASGKAGAVLPDAGQQHKARRTICKGWRNKQWHGRLMAFLRLLRGDREFIELKVSSDSAITLEGRPVTVTSPVSTLTVDAMPDDAEESDVSTLGNVFLEDEG